MLPERLPVCFRQLWIFAMTERETWLEMKRRHEHEMDRMLVNAMKAHNMNKTKAAEMIGIPRRTIQRRWHDRRLLELVELDEASATGGKD